MLLFENKLVQKFITFSLHPQKKSLLVTGINHHRLKNHKKNNYDYIVLDRVLDHETDIQLLLNHLYALLKPGGKLILVYHNYLFGFIADFISTFQNKNFSARNWLSTSDVKNFLQLSHFAYITSEPLVLFPYSLPVIEPFLNRLLLFLFPFNQLCRVYAIVAAKKNSFRHTPSVSIIIPARNEKGTIAKIFASLPVLTTKQQIIFVEGNSKDKTAEEIARYMKSFVTRPNCQVKLVAQENGTGKKDAVERGIAKATGEIIMIYDADMSVKIEDLRKFYQAMVEGVGEFINGSRLVYPLQGKAMQFINISGNKCFSLLYSFILGQPVKDTLCGTKVFWRKDYDAFMKDPVLHNLYDPFGDFFLLIGAARLHLKIIDLPVRYYERTYGATNIKRFKNAVELARFSLIAFKRLKMRYE